MNIFIFRKSNNGIIITFYKNIIRKSLKMIKRLFSILYSYYYIFNNIYIINIKLIITFKLYVKI